MKIDNFNGEFRFLSNFYNAPVKYKGLTYQNTEAAFHAQKDEARASEFTELNPSEAKRLGRRVNLRSDWNDIRVDVMYDINKSKFEQNPKLKEKLINTGDLELIEGNTWGDRFWGVCGGIGENKLGEILMRIRNEYKAKSKRE